MSKNALLHLHLARRLHPRLLAGDLAMSDLHLPVTAMLDYFNMCFLGLPLGNLQAVQNMAASSLLCRECETWVLWTSLASDSFPGALQSVGFDLESLLWLPSW